MTGGTRICRRGITVHPFDSLDVVRRRAWAGSSRNPFDRSLPRIITGPPTPTLIRSRSLLPLVRRRRPVHISDRRRRHLFSPPVQPAPPPGLLFHRDPARSSPPTTNQISLDPFALQRRSALPRAHDPRRGDPPHSPVAPVSSRSREGELLLEPLPYASSASASSGRLLRTTSTYRAHACAPPLVVRTISKRRRALLPNRLRAPSRPGRGAPALHLSLLLPPLTSLSL